MYQQLNFRLLRRAMMVFALGCVSVFVHANENGEKIYKQTCAACHQVGGVGTPPIFPALKGSKVVNGSEQDIIELLLKGRSGTAMLSFASLSDQDLADVLTYIRTSWGNVGAEITPKQVQAQRD